MLTLGEASKACHITKSGISKAIKNGRLSAYKNELGQYEIDPAELFRVFPVKPVNSEPEPPSLQRETSGLQAKVEALHELLHQVEGERDDLRSQRDRLLNIIEEQAGNIKQLTYKPTESSTKFPKRMERFIIGLAVLSALGAAVSWYIWADATRGPW
jgi:peptidoglycan hydrolase CwlO-like protein